MRQTIAVGGCRSAKMGVAASLGCAHCRPAMHSSGACNRSIFAWAPLALAGGLISPRGTLPASEIGPAGAAAILPFPASLGATKGSACGWIPRIPPCPPPSLCLVEHGVPPQAGFRKRQPPHSLFSPLHSRSRRSWPQCPFHPASALCLCSQVPAKGSCVRAASRMRTGRKRAAEVVARPHRLPSICCISQTRCSPAAAEARAFSSPGGRLSITM